jgi:RNA polymerase sigma-70 factor, ECF subfamily
MAIEEMADIESLYQRYAPDVRRFALFLAGDPVMADEITSDTFASAWLARERIRQPTVKSYLFAIARNLYRDRQRRQQRHAGLDENMTDKRIGAQTHMEQTAEVRAVLAALQQLPEKDRAALLMRALEEMPYEEIAETLGISVVTAKVKVYRARLKLMQTRQAWGKSFPPQEKDHEYYTGSRHGSVADLFFRRGQPRHEITG